MLACLLWGMVLPAAAEGEPTLYAKLEDEGDYLTELTIPVGLSRQFSFYTSADGISYEAVTAAPTSSDTAVAAITGEGNPFTIEGLAEGTADIVIADAEGNALSTKVAVSVPESTLQIRRADGEWGTSLSGISVNESVSVELRLGADTVFDDCTDSVTPSEGLTYSSGTLSAATAGTYTLTYNGYSVNVTVDPEPEPEPEPETTNEISISKDDLKVLSNQELFEQFLIDNHYSGSGDLTLVLPAGSLGSVTCSVHLNNGAGLILKGVSGTKMSVLTIADERITVDGITFEGASSAALVGITVNGVSSCTVENCKFGNKSSAYAFRLRKSADGKTPKLSLYNNTFGGLNVDLRDASNTSIGAWQSTSYDKSVPETVDFGVTVARGTNHVRAKIDGNMRALANDGWTFQWRFVTAAGFDKAFVVFDGEKINAAVGKTNLGNNMAYFTPKASGEYFVVKGTYPQLEKKDATTKILKVSTLLHKYLKKVTVSCKDFTAVKVTDSKGKYIPWEKDSAGNLTITLSGNSPYTIQKVETTKTVTKTVTKTQTTTRTYKYTYQDYYLVTPAGFNNAMRYVKDNLVTLNCIDAGRKSVSLPVSSMAAAAEKGYDVLVKTKNAELTLDAAALKSLAQQAKGTTVLLHYRSLNHKTLSTVGQLSIQSHLDQYPNNSADLAFLVTATSDGETIEDLQRGVITLKIPFIVLPGTEEMKNEVYALQSESVSEARETVVAEGYLTTKLQDLTEHMVFQVGEPVETTEETTEATEETVPETTEEFTETIPEEEEVDPLAEAAAEIATMEGVQDYLEEMQPKKSNPLPIVLAVLGVMLVAVGGVLAFVFLRKRKK